MTEPSRPLYNFANARTAEQLADMRALDAAGKCVFCPDNLRQDPDQPVLLETAHWMLTPNEFPYPAAKLHLLLVPHQHAEDLLDLAPEVQQDLWTALAEVRRRYQLSYYGFGVRNGDCSQTGGSIAHVHAHILVAEPGDERPLRMRFNAKPPRQP